MGSKIKILYTIPNFDTAGSGKALLKIAERLNKDVFEPHIMCYHNKGLFFSEIEKSGIPTHIFNFTTPLNSRLKGLWNCWAISRKFKSLAPDLIHSFHYSADYSEPLAARLAGIKWIYTKKSMNWGGASDRAWRMRSRLATWIVMQNESMHNLFFKSSHKVTLIRRGVDFNEFKPSGRALSLVREFGIGSNEKIVICVAYLTPVKQVEVLINAFGTIAEGKNYKLLIVGDANSDYGRQLMKLAESSSVGDKIVFTGKRLNIGEFHSIADLFVLPSKKESSPVALLEAMACGTVPLGSRTYGVEEILAPFQELLFNNGDSADLAEKMEKYLCMPDDQLSALKAQLVDYMVKNFSIEKEVEAHTSLYLNLVGKQQPAKAVYLCTV